MTMNRTWETLAENVGFTEGPLIQQDGAVVVTSIDRGILYRIEGREVSALAVVGGGPNGATEGPNGVVYVAQNGGAWPARPSSSAPGVQWVGTDGEVGWLREGGMTAPNDLAFGPDGHLYVTDPTRNEGRDDGRIWRLDIASGACELVAHMPWYPNGIGFTSETDAVYLADTGRGRIVRFTVGDTGLSNEEVVVQMEDARWHPDGFAFDHEMNIVIACPSSSPDLNGQIQVWSIEGQLLDCIDPPENLDAGRPSGGSRYLTNVAIHSDGSGNSLVVTDASGGKALALRGWPSRALGLHPFVKTP